MKIVGTAIAGVALGLAATWFVTSRGDMGDGVADGPWRTSLVAGSLQSDPYTRARVALHGLLALNRNETIYYTATEDGSGRRLDGKCRYQISGRDPNTRWWSVTAYGGDDYLIPNAKNLYSVSATSVIRKKDGSFVVDVGGGARPRADASWIPAGEGTFSLTLRLYNPGPDVAIDPEHAALPEIHRVWCP
ncbi:MAG TPA: DUF1214 domain-containing protein [Rhizomicrobium sp.]|nr:DUF1214 domain-containing protein [Rhizomicrobium sp.]